MVDEQELSKIQMALQSWMFNIAEKKGVRTQLQNEISSEEEILKNNREEQQKLQQANIFLMTAVEERRESAVKSIEAISTAALQSVYGDGYSLTFDTFEEKRQAGDNNFKMEIQIHSPYGKDEILSTSIDDECGMGVVEMSSYALRIATLEWLGYEGPILMDETHRNIGVDEKVTSVLQFIRTHTDEFKRQMIFVTHMHEQFNEISDRIFTVTKNSHGTSCVSVKDNIPITHIGEEEENI